MKVTAVAPSNIAFIKYWGTRDEGRTLPYNPSISMTLKRCVSRSTVEARPGEAAVEVLLRDVDGALTPAAPAFAERVERHCRRLAAWAEFEGGFRVATENSFPTGAGIASSASGGAATALAVAAALGRTPEAAELSRLARLGGSGSAARSALGGYVEWPAPGGGDEAVQLAAAGDWPLADLVAVVDAGEKEVSSREGHRRAPTSPYFERRLSGLGDRLAAVRRAIERRALDALGPVTEEEAIDLHLIAMSSRPPIFYWLPGTLAVLEAARRLRADGCPVWATIDAGPNVHLICHPASADEVARRVEALPAVARLIRDETGDGPRLVDDHLF